MSDNELWAVYLDYGLTSDAGSTARIVHTIPLGGSIGEREVARIHLGQMQWGDDWISTDAWEIDEDDLPFGYTFQTYYVARYFPETPAPSAVLPAAEVE